MSLSLNSNQLLTPRELERAKAIAAELRRRRLVATPDPLTWARQSATIVHPVRGRIAFEPYTYQTEFLSRWSEPRRIVLKARQVGYSQIFALEALYVGIHAPESMILLVSRSQDLAVNLLRYCYLTYNALRDAPALVKENESEMGFANGSRIKSIPANRSTGRGFAATRVYLDEFAYAEYADDIFQSVSPAISHGGNMTIASTPNGMGNMFHRLWIGGDNYVKQRINWRECPNYWTPAEQEAGIPPEQSAWYLENRPNYTAAAWAAEYDCDFSISGGQVFRNVRECIKSDTDPAAHAEHHTVMGVDFGQTNDYTVISVICNSCRQQIYIDRFNRMEWAIARDRIRAAAERFHVAQIMAERNSFGGPNIEALQGDLPVTAFDTTPSSKPPLIQALALAFERGELGLLDDTPQTLELEAYQMRRNVNTGHPTYSAPAGGHDDTVMALALAWRATQQSISDLIAW